MTDPALLPAAAFVVAAPLLLGAAVRDLAVRIIPNEIALGVALVGGLARVADGRLASAVIASAGVFVVTLLLWCRGWLGGGDVKLLAASVLLVSPAHVPGMLLTTAMAGSVLALLHLAMRALPARPIALAAGAGLPRRIWRAERWRIGRNAPLPYACAICAGVLLTLGGT